MKVSFLVTYYNQKEYVKQSIDSILAIDKPCDWEIIVGDDGSTDGTIDVIREYIRQYPDNIKMYVMSRESGRKYDSVKRASANRLNILEHSSGDVFCTLDGDDYYCDTKFIKDALNVFEENSGVTVVGFGYRYVTDGVYGDKVTLPTGVANKCVDKKMYLRKFYLPAGGCVHRKCFDEERIQYIKDLGYFDDNNIVVNSLNYGEMYAINKPIYAYRQTGQSVYTSMNELEQAVLNVQGMDVDLRLVDNSLKDTILERYSTSFIIMYIWRKEIHSILGEEKCKKYEDGCVSLMPSYCYDLLEYSALPKEMKTFLQTEYHRLAMNRRTFSWKQNVKHLMRRVFK